MGDQEQIGPKFLPEEERLKEVVALLSKLGAQSHELQELLERVGNRWVYEDKVYRFYHQSFKVFDLQETTSEIVAALQSLAPHLELNDWFRIIVKDGTGRKFDMVGTNDRWLEETRPILEAFFHARYFLEMACKFGPKSKNRH
jgi:hypothetical protein